MVRFSGDDPPVRWMPSPRLLEIRFPEIVFEVASSTKMPSDRFPALIVMLESEFVVQGADARIVGREDDTDQVSANGRVGHRLVEFDAASQVPGDQVAPGADRSHRS